jgi:hypothetical protein
MEESFQMEDNLNNLVNGGQHYYFQMQNIIKKMQPCKAGGEPGLGQADAVDL